ncbi:CD209 antigen-like isoform X1 [Thunnus thynnus]|uniref:CD209 antigen-like isoform X1 n=2 Tax=Thunnus thynnus TaxID=8237 RepID=UPI003528019D
MTVEYKSFTVTNMDVSDSKTSYKQLLEDGMPNLRLSAYALRNNPLKVATVCLGLLCVVLLVGIIGQSVHYKKVEQDHQNKITDMNKEKDNVQENLRTVQKEKRNLEANRNQLQQSLNFLAKRKDQIQTNNNLLIEEKKKLKQDQSQLQTTNAALSKELEQQKASKVQLQTNNDALTKARDMFKQQHDTVLNSKNEIQGLYNSAIKERDNLQNKFNNATRSREQLQLSYNALIKNVEHLQDRYNFSSGEKDKLASRHQNLTMEKDTLQATYNLLVNATDVLQASYNSLIQEKKELESSCKNVTEERDLLKMKNNNLTAERDQLQREVERLNTTIQDKKCPSGWRKFELSCYYTSIEKKTWSQSREYCKSKGADLAIIKSQAEMTFINSLYGSEKEVWIGLTDEGVEGQWKWVDGTPLTTTFWGSGQPNSYNGRDQDCVEFWHRATKQGDWNDENCNIAQNWICEI